MSEMWIDVDTAVALPVNILPLIADTDFKTIKTGIVFDSAGMTLLWNFETTAGVMTQTAVTPTVTSGTGSGNDYDWENLGNGMYSVDLPASGGASANNDATGFGWFTGVVDGVLPFRGPVFGFRAAALNNALIDGGDNLDVNVVQWLSQAVTLSSNNRPDVNVDEWGDVLLGTTDPLIQSLKNAGIILSRSTIETVNSQTEFVIPDTDDATDNDSYNGALAVIIDAGDPNQRSFRLVTDYVAATRAVTIASAADFTVLSGDTLVILAGATSTTVWDRVLTGATHNLSTSAGRRLRNIQDFGIYDLGSVWVDEIGGQSSGTTAGEDATVSNRADDFDNAQTVASNVEVNMDSIHIQNGNTITLAATLNGFNVWSGAPNARSVTWTLALGTRDIGNSFFSGAKVSGVGTGTTPAFRDCIINAVTLPPCRVSDSSIVGDFTVGSAGDFQFIDCKSGVPGSGTPTVDVGSGIGASTLEFRRWSGGLTLTNIEAGDVISIDSITGGTITLTMTGGTVEVRGAGQKNLVVNGSGGTVNVSGNIGVITDNSSATVTITTTWAQNQSLIADAVWDETMAGHSTADTSGLVMNDWQDAGRLDTILDTIATDTTTDIPALIATVQADLDIITGADGVNLLSATQASIDAIEADTNELQADDVPGLIAAVQADLPNTITKNVALASFPFFMVLTSDHVTGGTGLTVTAQRSIDGAAFGNAANAVAEIGNGIYKIDLDAADLNGDTICLKFTAATADARIITIVTKPT